VSLRDYILIQNTGPTSREYAVGLKTVLGETLLFGDHITGGHGH
jgi:hypothetical protein